jgi:hypothetical protein
MVCVTSQLASMQVKSMSLLTNLSVHTNHVKTIGLIISNIILKSVCVSLLKQKRILAMENKWLVLTREWRMSF